MEFAKRTRLIKSSDTRDLLNIIGFEDMISFAGGLPNRQGFPLEALKGISEKVFEAYGYHALQYGPTEGIRALRQEIAAIASKKHHMTIEAENILITSGGQQALDILGKVFIDEGDDIMMEEPTYFSAINVFRSYYPEIHGIDTDEMGVCTEDLQQQIKLYPKAKFAYYIPDYQNPTGKTWTYDRKLEILKHHQVTGIPIIEDCPYSDIIFEGEAIPSFYEMAQGNQVIHIGSFSKVFCPGFRLGYIMADQEVIRNCVLMKQSMDLHTASFSQMMLLEYIKEYGLQSNIDKVRTLYKHKRDQMIAAIKSYLPDVTYTIPTGGMFLWVELGLDAKGQPYDSRKLYKRALEAGVAFVAGDAFYIDGRISSGIRLNYTNTSDDLVIVGIQRIAKLLESD